MIPIARVGLAIVLLVAAISAGAAPGSAVSAASDDQAVATIIGRAVHDANRSGAAEPGEGGIGDVVAFIDRDGDGQLGDREPRARSDATGAFRLQTLLAGLAHVCVTAPPTRVRTTARCQVIDVRPGEVTAPVAFGFDGFSSRCPGGGVIDTIVGVGARDGVAHAPSQVAGPARGPWAGSRLAVDPGGRAPMVYARLGERFRHVLVIAPHPSVARPVIRLTLAPGRERVVGVMLADGTPAANLGRGRRLPSPRPTAFSYFDQRGEILIFSPPRHADDGFQDVVVVTEVRTGTTTFTLAARLDTAVRVDGRTLPTCRDSSVGRGFVVRR